MKGSPMWDAFLAMAPTLVYDGLAMGGDDQSLPVNMFARGDEHGDPGAVAG
jgi:hypothetical protein